MADATKLPPLTSLTYFQWSRKGAPAPKLDAPIDADDTTLQFSDPPLDEAGAVVTEAFLMGVRKADGWVETIYVPAGALSADGYTATGVVRGVDPAGIDYTTGSASFADEHSQDEPIFCSIPALIPSMLVDALQGLIATGGANLIIGTDASGTITIKRSSGTGTSLGVLRWNSATSKAQYSNDGSTWINFDDTAASVVAKVSANDTTAGYLNGKLVAGSGISFTENNDGGNETLSISTSLPARVVAPATYTPAYLTGDTGAQATYNNWLAVLDGSFAITIDGTARSVTGINFTGVTSMNDVAAKIQAAIRALTGSTETVVWSTNHFVISSVNTTATSAITVTSAAGSGTDISGAGAADWMDCDTGNGVVTAAVLNQPADAGKIPELDATGKIDDLLIPWLEGTRLDLVVPFTTGEAIDGSSTPQAVYYKASDGKVWRTDSDATESTFAFVGFITTNAGSNESVNVKVAGLISGFTGLTAGDELYPQAGAGTIGATPGTYIYKFARAVSTTTILIEKGGRMMSGIDLLATGQTAGNKDTTVTLGFRPKTIQLQYCLNGFDGSVPMVKTGIATFKETTMISNMTIGNDVSATQYLAETIISTVNATDAIVGGENTGSNDGIVTVTIPTVSNTGFVLRKAVAGDGIGIAQVATKIAWTAWA